MVRNRRRRCTLFSFLVAMVIFGILDVGCLKKPNKPDNTDPSHVLLQNPVYSPLDTCVYYMDSGADSAYYEKYKRGEALGYWPVVQPGIYRVSLNGDDPAELVAANGVAPGIIPDGSTLFYIDGGWGGAIWKKTLPDGEPVRVKDGGL